jgi:hypothetical protein
MQLQRPRFWEGMTLLLSNLPLLSISPLISTSPILVIPTEGRNLLSH